jgi:hypothetical protein
MTTVLIDGRAARYWPLLRGVAPVPPGAIVVGPTGEILRIGEDGSAAPVLPPGYARPGIAANPCAHPAGDARPRRSVTPAGTWRALAR